MKTTPLLGLKLYDGTDAPDLVSGYNASMEKLDAKRLFRYLGTFQNSDIDLNNCHETGYWNNYDHDFTEDNHGPVGSFNRGILVVYDKCNAVAAQGKCLRQEYYPEPYGTGDAYRPMVRTLNSDTLTWTEWRPLVEVPEPQTWETLEGKPFSTVGTSLTTSGNTLDLSTAAQASLVPAGGAAGQVLSKKSATDHDCVWTNPSALTNVLSLGAASVTISEDHDAGEDFNNLVNAGVEVVTFNGGGAYPVFISYSLAAGSASIKNMPAIGAIAMPNGISISITAILPVPKPQSTEILAIPLIITVRKAYKSVVQLSSNDAGYANNGIRVTPFVYSIGEAS